MTTVNVYLTFNGNCETAFGFYKSVFGGEFANLVRFKDMPPPGATLSAEAGEKIMHVALPVSTETLLMGSDTGDDRASGFVAGNNFAISINSDTRNETDRIFKDLAKDGTVTMPLMEAPWGDYFGMFTDKFGINWMISHNPKMAQ